MQTFLPFKSFFESAKCLDHKRLGKQRAEVKQLLIANHFEELKGNIALANLIGLELEYLTHDTYGNIAGHPAAAMWLNHSVALIAYGLEICAQWTARGFRDDTAAKIEAFMALQPKDIIPEQSWLENNLPELLPKWLGDSRFHDSHKSMLLIKDLAYYSRYGWEITTKKYFWPGEDYYA